MASHADEQPQPQPQRRPRGRPRKEHSQQGATSASPPKPRAPLTAGEIVARRAFSRSLCLNGDGRTASGPSGLCGICVQHTMAYEKQQLDNINTNNKQNKKAKRPRSPSPSPSASSASSSPPPVRRGRGRPRGSLNKAALVDHMDHDDKNADADYVEKGSGKRTRPSTSLPVPVVYSEDAAIEGLPLWRAYDIDFWDEDPRDVRHTDSRLSGVFVVSGHPLVDPRGFVRCGRVAANGERTIVDNGMSDIYTGESVENIKQRMECLKQSQAALDEAINGFLHDAHSRVFASLSEFVRRAVTEQTQRQAAAAAEAQRDQKSFASSFPVTTQLPVGLLMTGVNVADHGLIFQQLRQAISTTANDIVKHEQTGHFCAIVNAAHCSRVSLALSSIASSLLHSYPIASGVRSRQSLHIDAATRELQAREKRLIKEPIDCLLDWYKQQRSSAKIVLIFEELEAFEGVVLSELIALLSGHARLRALPFVYILGVATDASLLHSLFPQRLLSRFCLRHFSLPAPAALLERLSEQFVSAGPLALQIGPDTERFLEQFFYQDNYSVASYKRAMNFIMARHLDSVPLANIIRTNITNKTNKTEGDNEEEKKSQAESESESESESDKAAASDASIDRRTDPHYWRSIIDKLATVDLQQFRRFPSMAAASNAHSDPNAFIDHVSSCIADLFKYRSQFSVHFHVFSLLYQKAAASQAARADRRLDDRQLERECRGGNAGAIEPAKKAIVSWLTHAPEAAVKQLLGQLAAHYRAHALDGLASEVSQLLEQGEESAPIAAASVNASSGGSSLKRFGDRRAALLSVAHKAAQSSASSRERLRAWFAHFASHALRPFTALPLHELMWFDDHNVLRAAFQAQPRAALVTALLASSYYRRPLDEPLDLVSRNHELQQFVASTSSLRASAQPQQSDRPSAIRADSPSAALPDVCIAFHLFEQAGRLVNLADWFTAFASFFTDNASASATADNKANTQQQFKATARRPIEDEQSSASESEGDGDGASSEDEENAQTRKRRVSSARSSQSQSDVPYSSLDSNPFSGHVYTVPLPLLYRRFLLCLRSLRLVGLFKAHPAKEDVVIKLFNHI